MSKNPLYDSLLKMQKEMAQVKAIRSIQLIGSPANLKFMIDTFTPPAAPPNPLTGPIIARAAGINVIASNFMPKDEIWFIVDGKLRGKILLGDPAAFFKQWEAAGKDLDELIKRLEAASK